MRRPLPRTTLGLAVVLILPLTVPVSAYGTGVSVTEQIGEIAISIPSPPGFVEPSELVPRLRAFGETMTDARNRLLAMFVADCDIKLGLSGREPEYDRYFTVQTFRETEAGTLTATAFSGLRDDFRKQYQGIFKDSVVAAQ